MAQIQNSRNASVMGRKGPVEEFRIFLAIKELPLHFVTTGSSLGRSSSNDQEY